MATVRAFEERDAATVRGMMSTLAQQREGSTHQRVLSQRFERFFTPYMMGLLENPDAVVRVAEDDGKVVGYAVATRAREQPLAKFGRVGVLNDVFVAESHRGSGVGHDLLEAVRRWAEKAGLDALEVEVAPDRTKEVEALEKLGFFQYRTKMLWPFGGR